MCKNTAKKGRITKVGFINEQGHAEGWHFDCSEMDELVFTENSIAGWTIEELKQYKKDNRILVFMEPHCTGGDATVRVSTQKAIYYHKLQHPDLTDAEALDDFMVVNWATYEDEQNAPK